MTKTKTKAATKAEKRGETQPATPDYLHLHTPREKIKLLYEPHGYAEGMARGSLGWQMEYSATTLEEALAAEGRPHLLQLALHGPDRREPEAWELYADGKLVAAGDGAWARACFVRRADEFRDVLRAAVEASGLEPLTPEGYRILKSAAASARWRAGCGRASFLSPRARMIRTRRRPEGGAPERTAAVYIFTMSLFQELAVAVLLAVAVPVVLIVWGVRKLVQRHRAEVAAKQARERKRIEAEERERRRAAEAAEKEAAERLAATTARYERNTALWTAAYEARWASILNCYGDEWYRYAGQIAYWGEDGDLSSTYGPINRHGVIDRLHSLDKDDIKRARREAYERRSQERYEARLREHREFKRLSSEESCAERAYFANTYGEEEGNSRYWEYRWHQHRFEDKVRGLLSEHTEEEARAIALAHQAERDRAAESARLERMADDAEAAWYLESFGREAQMEAHRAAVRAAKLEQIRRLVGNEQAEEFLAKAYPELA